MTEAWGLIVGASLLAGVCLGPSAIPLVLLVMVVLQLVQGKIEHRSLIVVALVVLLGSLRGGAVDHSAAPSDVYLSTGATGQVISIPKASPGGIRAEIDVSELMFKDGRTISASFRAMVRLPAGAQVASGDQVRVVWTVDQLETLPPGYGRYVESRGGAASGLAWSVNVEQRGSSFLRYLSRLQMHLTDGLRLVVPGDAGSLAAGVVTGNDAALGEGVREAFLRTGTTHITAVSGSNVAMLLALWNVLLTSSRTRRALIVQVTIVGTIWLYAILVGLEPSAVRAAVVASLGIFSGRFGRKADPLTILLLTIGGMAFWNPDYTRMIGFWLSVVASFAIISRMPATGRVTPGSAMKGIAEGVLLAQAATLPLVLLTFGTWSLSSILANLLIQPAMLIAFPLTFVLALVVLVAPSLAPVIAWIPGLVLDFVLAVVTRLSPLVSPVQVDPSSIAALVGISVPSYLVLVAASPDVERWAHVIDRRWPVSQRMIVALLLISISGIAVGFVASLIR